jgi:hypothetical protein
MRFEITRNTLAGSAVNIEQRPADFERRDSRSTNHTYRFESHMRARIARCPEQAQMIDNSSYRPNGRKIGSAIARSAPPFPASLKPCSTAAKARRFVCCCVSAANAFGTIKAGPRAQFAVLF